MFVVKNTGLGSVTLSEVDLQRLSDGSHETYVTVSGGTSISVSLCLNNNIYVENLRCYSPSLTDELTLYGSAADGVWQDELSYSPSTSGVISNVGTDYAYFRTDIEPSANLDVYGFAISFEYPLIKFGYSADEDIYDIDKNYGEQQEIRIQNDLPDEKDFFIFIDAEGGFDYLSISGTDEQGFVSYHDDTICFPDDFSWAAGQFVDTMPSGVYVVLSGTTTFGYYISPAFEFRNDVVVRPFWEEEQTTNPVYVDLPENVEGPRTVGVRLYNNPPTLDWVDGQLPNEDDPIWASSGTLSYVPYTNDQPLEVRYSEDYLYAQFYVGLYSETIGHTPVLSRLGIEYPTMITGVPYLGYSSIYAKVDPPISSSPADSGLLVYSLG